MNQDFTVQKNDGLLKKGNICLKKKFVQRGSPEKKKSCTSSERKNKFVQAENTFHFSNGLSPIGFGS